MDMSSRSPNSQYDETDGPTGMVASVRDSASKQTYNTKKNISGNMKSDGDMAIADRGRTRNAPNNSPDNDKMSDSYYSDDEDNTTYGSDRSPTPSSKSMWPREKRAEYKASSVTPVHKQSIKKVRSKNLSNKRGPRFSSQSVNKESSVKDVDGVTKRVLSAQHLKINELGNKVAELQLKLEKFQKENKTLKMLQFRQEKALYKFEDTGNEMSQFITRYNYEIRTLKELLRKSQEKERNAEKRLKETDDELYKANGALKKLKQLSENRHLAEREELTKKLDLTESRLDERERRVKELEKNRELSENSFMRQLMSERKKAHDTQEENKLLKEEIQRLIQKLKEKERELDIKNIFAYRFSKPSSKKDTELTPRKKGTNLGISIGVQTNDYAWLEFSSPPPPPPPPPGLTDDEMESQQKVLRIEEDNIERQLKQEAEKLRKEKDQAERKRDQEEKQIRDKEQKILEDKAEKLRDEWEKEELEKRRKEASLDQNNLVKEENLNRTEEERLRKKLLLAKMFEIDRANQDSFYSDSSKPLSPTHLLDTPFKVDTTNTKQKTYKFSEPTEKLFNGLPVQSERDLTTRKGVESFGDFKFGTYTPSFGSGKPAAPNQKKDVSEDHIIITNSKLDIQKEKKSSLMEELFGNSSNTTLPSIPKVNDQSSFALSNSKVTNHNSSNSLLLEQNISGTGKVPYQFSGDGKNISSSRHRLQHAPGRAVVKAVDSVEDEIEEVVL
ncbi:lebercilin isoform X2 [Pseudophryne corroboree]|uniref:lebercilin isoform X2 n=1 Tax=Pseudophryne corroboree TaxID=495146 RepID=UPI0030819643